MLLTMTTYCFPREGNHIDRSRTVVGFGLYKGDLLTPPLTKVFWASEIPENGL